MMTREKPILILAAVEQEIALLRDALGASAVTRDGVFPHHEGMLGTRPVAICVGGIGKINAAAATTALIERLQPRLVVNTGCGGAYLSSGLAVGDLAVASDECLGDEGVLTSGGWHDLQFMGIPSLPHNGHSYHNRLPLSRHLAEKAVRLADGYGLKLRRGPFVTVSTCSGTRQRGDELAGRYNGICENMEGAAVVQVCLRYGIDCMELRGISNMVDERNMKSWDIPRAVEAAQRFLLKYLEMLEGE